MGKCWQLLSWDIPLKLMRLNADDKAKAVVLEPKENYANPKEKMQCPKCGDELRPMDAVNYDTNRILASVWLLDNWGRDGTFTLALNCPKCGWRGEAGCVVVEVKT